MIDCFDFSSAHHFGDALASQFRLRHQVFVERTNYQVPTWNDMEYDQYDTPATTYFVWRDEDGVARGVARLCPTDRPYMLKDFWPDMVTAMPLPSSRSVWEGTRFGVDKTLSSDVRRRVIGELVLGYIEHATDTGIRQIIGVMPTLILRAVFASHGWPVQILGEPRTLGGDKCAAAMLPVSGDVLAKVRAKTGISKPILVRHDSSRHAALRDAA